MEPARRNSQRRMTDRERTRLAAVEALVGAAFAVAGALILPVLGGIPGIVLLVFGGGAVVQAVMVGTGLLAIGERKQPD